MTRLRNLLTVWPVAVIYCQRNYCCCCCCRRRRRSLYDCVDVAVRYSMLDVGVAAVAVAERHSDGCNCAAVTAVVDVAMKPFVVAAAVVVDGSNADVIFAIVAAAYSMLSPMTPKACDFDENCWARIVGKHDVTTEGKAGDLRVLIAMSERTRIQRNGIRWQKKWVIVMLTVAFRLAMLEI